MTDPTSRYPIPTSAGETARLRMQADAMAPDTAILLDRIGVGAGWHCLDLACGCGGITDLLAARVGAEGQVLGLDRDPDLVRKDARNQIISLTRANKVYGVILDTNTELWDVDYPATKKLRQEIRKQRPKQPTISTATSEEI